MKHSRPRETHSFIDEIPTHDSHDFVDSLLPLLRRQERESRGQLLLEGVRAVHLALETDALQTLLYASNGDRALLSLVDEARQSGVRCVAVERSLLQQLACGEDPQGVVGVATRRAISLQEAFVDEGIWVVLESARAGNIGSILRTSEAAGARGIIAIGPDVDFLNPLVTRSSMGAFWAQTLVRTTFDEALNLKFARDVMWFGTALEGSVVYDSIQYPRDFWLWMGDEQSGLSTKAQGACDQLLSIPMAGRVDSLNLGVATAIVLYNARRR